jgi:hypothetical protein
MDSRDVSASTGITDPWELDLTITRVKDVETPEPPTAILLLSAIAARLLLFRELHP